MAASIWRRVFMCRFGLCGMVPNCNDQFLWGECQRCGKRAGVTSRAAIRAYIEAEETAKEAREAMKAAKERILRPDG